MTDPIMWTAISGASLAGIVVVTIAALKGWRDWIGLQRLSLEGRGHSAEPAVSRRDVSGRLYAVHQRSEGRDP